MHTNEKSATLPSRKKNFDRNFLYSFIRRNSDGNIAQEVNINFSKGSTKKMKTFVSLNDEKCCNVCNTSPPLTRLTTLNSSMPKLPARRCFNALPKPWQPQLKVNVNKATSNELNICPTVSVPNYREMSPLTNDRKCFLENEISKFIDFELIAEVDKDNKNSTNVIAYKKCQNDSLPNKSSTFNDNNSKIPSLKQECKKVNESCSQITNQNKVQQVVIHENEEGVQIAKFPSNYKYSGDNQGNRSLPEPLVTKYSISGSTPYTTSEEFASTQKNSAVNRNYNSYSSLISSEQDYLQKENRKKTLLSCFKNREPESRSGSISYAGFRLPLGGSGHGDRSAPRCSKETHSVSLDSKLKRKSVRKRPIIPNNLCRRNSCEDVQGKLGKSDHHNFVSTFSLPGSPIIRTNRTSCRSGSNQKNVGKSQEQTKFLTSGKITVHSILSTLNFAKYRLEELTVNRGNSSKREINKNLLQSDQSKSTLKKNSKFRNDLEKLKKSTEKLKATVEPKNSMEPLHPFETLPPESSRPIPDKGIPNKSRGILKRQSAVVRTFSSPASPHPEGNFHQFQRKSRSTSKNKNVSLSTVPVKNAMLQTRDIPFRSASVSQVDFNNDYRPGNSSPSLRLYPACKDYGRSNTLPRIKLQNDVPDETAKKKSDHFISPNPDSVAIEQEDSNKITENYMPDDRPLNEDYASWIGGVSSVETSQNPIYIRSNMPHFKEDRTSLYHNAVPEGSNVNLSGSYQDFTIESNQQHLLEQSGVNNSEFSSKLALDAAKKMFLKAKLSDLIAASNSPSVEAKSLQTIEESLPLINEQVLLTIPLTDTLKPSIAPDNLNCKNYFIDQNSDSVLSKQNVHNTFEESFKSPHYSKIDSSTECHIQEKEQKISQCLLIRSTSLNRNENNLEGSLEPFRTSECQGVPVRPRLSIGDSESESIERGKIRKLHNQTSDEATSADENSYRIPDFSDSSSQDSYSTSSERLRLRLCSSEPDINISKYLSDYAVKHLTDLKTDNMEKSLTYPPLRKVRFQSINKQRSNLLQGGKCNKNLSNKDLHLYNLSNVASQIETLLLYSDKKFSIPKGDDCKYNSADVYKLPKKRRNSDPGQRRDTQEENISYFSDSNVEFGSITAKRRAKQNKAYRHQSAKVVISQDSTDSEGRDQHLNSNVPCKVHMINSQGMFSPQVILSDHENETSYLDCSNYTDAYNNRYEYSRNASPVPYFVDSDTGDRSAPRSPQIPRRYSKRPLRGPYGEMLEAEMSKSKSSSLLLAEDTYLQPRDSSSVSPRPCSPTSPIHLSPKSIENRGASPMFLIGDTPLTDLRPVSAGSYFSLDSDQFENQESEESKVSFLNAKIANNSESDNEPSYNLLSPSHHRTTSSPSKLFFQEDDNEILGYFPKNSPKSNKKESSRKSLLPKPKRTSETKLSLSSTKKSSQNESKEERSPTDHRLHWRQRDTRAHIIGELHDTEKNYVANLNFLLTKYHSVLKKSENQNMIEPNLVDDIFFQVPEIHSYHAKILEELRRRIDMKDQTLCVGDLLSQKIRDPKLVESYKSFVRNWKTAQDTANMAANSKPAFRQFLSSMTKEHRGKGDLKGLLIIPVQRFPHYELILKRLLQHTSREHPDYSLLKEAIIEVQKVGAIVNAVGQESFRQEEQQIILREIENFIEGLDCLVQNDRSFIQLDQVTQLSSLSLRKERCLFLFTDILILTAIKRRSATIRKSSSLQVPLLSSLESNKLKLLKFIPLDELEIGRSREDSIKKLGRELEALKKDLQTLQQVSRLIQTLHFPKGPLEDSVQDLNSGLRKQLIDRQSTDSLCELELNINTQEGIETLSLMFSSPDKRNSWEESFTSAKQKLAMSEDRITPPEFVVAVPIRKTRAGLQFTCAAPTFTADPLAHKDVWVCNSDGYVGQVCVLRLQSDPEVVCCNEICNARILSIASIPSTQIEEYSEDDEDVPVVEDDCRTRRSGSLPSEMCSEEINPTHPTVWLGTEDGSIYIYSCSDTIRTKNKLLKFQPGSSVHCIIHIENRVFASLANGNVIVYERDAQGYWTEEDRKVLSISSVSAPVIRMVLAAGKLWCSTANHIKVLNVSTLQVEISFEIKNEHNKCITCLVSAGQGVWIALQNSATVKLYHASNYEWICDVSVASSVTKMIAGWGDIIRQHKEACLKITSLLICKDLLWVGTTAGVIVTLPLSHVSTNQRRLHNSLNTIGIPFGHTGHVRFLTCVEVKSVSRASMGTNEQCYSFLGKEQNNSQDETSEPSKFLVISGGDGFEDFKNSGNSEVAGKHDSTNHLLLWQV